MIFPDSIYWLIHRLRYRSLREAYWDFAEIRALKRTTDSEWSAFLQGEKAYQKQSFKNLSKVDDLTRLKAAVDWLIKAQNASPDRGVSHGFFPKESPQWRGSYPETTGYIITTLLKYSDIYDDSSCRESAIEMSVWESSVQMGNGAVQGGILSDASKQTAAAFNTGMVLDGWCSAYEATGDTFHLEAAKKAAHFLRDDLSDDGFFQTNGGFVSKGIKTYTCLVCWSMLRYAKLAGDDSVAKAAERSLEAALTQRNASGCFRHNCLVDPNAPLSHTIGYVLQGLLESGFLLDRKDFIDAARLGVSNALKAAKSDGWLSGRLNETWSGPADWVCLTGSCQLAIVAYRLAEYDNDIELKKMADKVLNFVKSCQRLEFSNEGYVGGIPGSFPIAGEYMRGGYPNWATKYYVDALMLQLKMDQ